MMYLFRSTKYVNYAVRIYEHSIYDISQSDPSSFIIKRWVPEYEQEFLWDHTYKLREKRSRHDYQREARSDDKDTRKNEKMKKYEGRHRRRSYDLSRSYTREDNIRSNTTRPTGRSRHSSTESIRSAPNTDEIARRRTSSRTLSEERQRESVSMKPDSVGERMLRGDFYMD
jgi:hypothetical protein